MNKKFLSAILFGALMVTSTGTFVSCKDYDDDIDNINKELTDIKSQIAALQTKVNEGKWITNLAPTTGGFTVTFSDGTSYTIANGKDGAQGPAGAAGTSVEVKDGIWYIDGKATDYVAVTKDELGKVKVPFIKDGVWYFYNEAGEAVASTYKAVGNAWAVKANGTWTLHMPDANGVDQAIELPGAGSMITGLTFGTTGADAGFYPFKVASATFTYKSNDLIAKNNWAGTETIPTDKSRVYTSASSYSLRVNPVNVDAKEIAFTLTNTKNKDLEYITLNASEEDKELNTGNIAGRAAQGNGLYTLAMDNFVLTESQATSYDKTLTALNGANPKTVFAVNADHSFRSAYQVTVATATAPTLTKVCINENTPEYDLATTKTTVTATTQTKVTVDVNAKNTVYPLVAEKAAMYDMFIDVPKEYADVFGLVIGDDKRTFTVTKNPDTSTIEAWFPMYVYTLDITGEVKVACVRVELSTKINQSEYALITHNVSSNPNMFSADLTTMYNGLGSNLNTWKINVDLSKTDYKLYEKYEDGALSTEKSVNADLFTELIVKEVKANATAVTSVNDAKFIQVKVDNSKAADMTLDKTYYLGVTFMNGSSSVLNTIVIPVKFVAPTVADQFTVKAGYVKDGAINAYFYELEEADVSANKVVTLNKYFSKYIEDAAVSLGTAKVGATDKTSANLANLTADDAFKTATMNLNASHKKATPNEQFELGYGETLAVKASKETYGTWTYSKAADKAYNFNIRIMSPIEQGSVKPVSGSTITIMGNDLVKGAKITDKMIMGYDYNGNEYNVVPDKIDATTETTPVWANPQIKSVTPGQDADKYIKAATVEAATKGDKDVIVNGAFVVKGESISNTVEVKMPIVVEDAWGYTLTEKVSVTIKKN